MIWTNSEAEMKLKIELELNVMKRIFFHTGMLYNIVYTL